MRWAEVVPALPLLIPLAQLLIWSLCLAICLASGYIVKGFFGITGSVLGKLPIVGGWIDSGLHSIEQKLTSEIGKGAIACDRAVGAALHSLARIVDWLGHEIRTHSSILHTLAALITGQRFADELAHLRRQLTRELTVAEHNADIALRRIAEQERRLAHGIGSDVLPHLRSLDKELEHVINPELAALRARARELEDGALRTFRWIRAHPGTLAATAFAGAVAWALARLGGGWIRCARWRKIGQRVCGFPSGWVDDLLGLVADFLIIDSICQVLPWLEDGASIVAGPLVAALTEVGAGLCDPNSHPPELLPAPALHLPAAPSLALYLP